MKSNTRTFNIGTSDYCEHEIQCWDIVWGHKLTYYEGVMLGYLLRNKDGEDKITEYQKLVHNAMEVRDHSIAHDRMKHYMGKPSRRYTISKIADDYHLDKEQTKILNLIINANTMSSFSRMFTIIKLTNKLIIKETQKQK